MRHPVAATANLDGEPLVSAHNRRREGVHTGSELDDPAAGGTGRGTGEGGAVGSNQVRISRVDPRPSIRTRPTLAVSHIHVNGPLNFLRFDGDTVRAEAGYNTAVGFGIPVAVLVGEQTETAAGGRRGLITDGGRLDFLGEGESARCGRHLRPRSGWRRNRRRWNVIPAQSAGGTTPGYWPRL